MRDLRMKQLCHKYLKSRVNVKSRTITTYTSAMDKHIIPKLGNKIVTELTKMDATELMSDLKNEGKSNSTINKTLVLMKCMATYAIDTRLLTVSPFRGIKRLKTDDRNYGYWTEKEGRDFIEKAKDLHLCNLFKFALNTGLRRGEICGLQWKNVKINNGNVELHFTEQLLPGRVRDTVKSGVARFVPLSIEAQAVLNDIGRKGDNDYVFTMKRGDSVEPNFLSIEFRRIQKLLGIENSIKFHGLRHSFASLLTAKGVNIQRVQHLLGHADCTITERYSHLNQSDLRETIKMVGF